MNCKFHLHYGCLLFLDCIATIFLLTSLLAPFLLRVVAGVSFDPDVYMVNEGGNVTLILKTNVTVNKRFSVLVNTRDDSANSKYCISTALFVKCNLIYTTCKLIIPCCNYCSILFLTYIHATHPSSCVGPADYQGGETSGIFEIGSDMATVKYITINDSTREGIESFTAEVTVSLEIQAMGIVPGMPDRTTVNIIDDEG